MYTLFQLQVNGVGGLPGALAALHVVEVFVLEQGNVRGKVNVFQEKASSLNNATARTAAPNSAEIMHSFTVHSIQPLAPLHCACRSIATL